MSRCQNPDCDIAINPSCDESHSVNIECEKTVLCDGCYNDYLLFGDNFAQSRRKLDEQTKVKVGEVA